MVEQILQKPVCPSCGSDCVVKNGSTHGKKKLLCKTCGRGFLTDAIVEPKLKKTENKPIITQKLRKTVKVDSIISCPCFLCPISGCEPNFCEKLTEYLEKEGAKN